MAKIACDLLVRHGRTITMNPSREIFADGAVAVGGRRILDVGRDAELAASYDAVRTLDAQGGIVHPGFIDAHNHIVHTSCRGVFNGIHDRTGKANFATWKAAVDDADEAAATEMACLEMLRSGFTMFVEPGSLFSTDAGAAAVARLGLRALVSPPYLWDRQETFEAIPALTSPALMARVPVDRTRCLAQLDAELHRNRNPDALVRGFVFVYGEGTASMALFAEAKAVTRAAGAPLHLHAGYVPAGAEVYRRLFGSSQLEDLAEAGLLDADTVVVHGNALEAGEETMLRSSGCQLVWCPAAFLSLGLAGKTRFLMAERARAGVSVSLGADGTFDAPPAETMRAARFVSQSHADPVTAETLLEMQTLNAARAAGMADEIGSLEAGKRADIVVRSPWAAEAHPANNPAHLLALNLGPGSVETVLVDGRVVFEGGRSALVDEAEVLARVDASVTARARRLDMEIGSRWPTQA